MSYAGSRFRFTSRVVLCGAGLVFFCVAFKRLRRSSSSSPSSSAASNSDSGVSQNGVVCNRSVLPIKVFVANLPTGWAIAPAIFDSPRVAILPLLQPCATEGNAGYESHGCFILCEGPMQELTLESETDALELFTRYIMGRNFLADINVRDVVLRPIEETDFLSAHSCLTHVAIADSEHLAVVFGRNGPYIILLIATNYGQFTEKEKTGLCFPTVTPNDIQMIVNACQPVPLIDNVRLPNTPNGLLQGRLRLTCVHKDCNIVFTISSGVRIQTDEKNVPILSLESDVLPVDQIALDSTLLDKIVRGDSLESLFSTCGTKKWFSAFVSVQVTEERDNSIKQTISDNVTAVFAHSALGVYFSVNPRNTVLREPTMTNDLCVFYYPCGDNEMDEKSDIIPPLASIRLLKELPPTWQKYLSTDDDLKHNVLLHFTDWAHKQVPCNMTELSGYRCVQLYEEKDGLSCRSYVIPLERAIFVIRWEVKSSDWEKHLPLLHGFLDTLHLADPTA